MFVCMNKSCLRVFDWFNWQCLSFVPLVLFCSSKSHLTECVSVIIQCRSVDKIYTSFEIARVRYKVFKLDNLASIVGLILPP